MAVPTAFTLSEARRHESAVSPVARPTIQAAVAAIKAMGALREEEMNVESRQERFATMATS